MTAHGPTLLDDHDALLLDLDGVVYVGPDPVAHAVDALRAAAATGVATAYVTNNAARPPEVVAEHLRSFGLDVQAHDVVTSAQAGAREVALRVPPGSPVLAVGGPGVALALAVRGLVPVGSADPRPAAVLMGYGPDVSWRELAEAAYAVGDGAVLVATNLDLSIPTDRGIAPGNGTLVGAVVSATGVEPAAVAGKPYAPLVLESIERVGAARPLMVGDRLDTDIEAGHRSGIPSLLVLTGVTGVVDLLAAPPSRRPTYLAADLRGLALPRFVLALAPPEGPVTDDGLASLRAACRAAWSAADAGEPGPAYDLEQLAADVVAALTS
ncbi:MAG: HAD-IIA family hydrolase [Candidatus Nanopelagicales bacterium]